MNKNIVAKMTLLTPSMTTKLHFKHTNDNFKYTHNIMYPAFEYIGSSILRYNMLDNHVCPFILSQCLKVEFIHCVKM